MQKGITIENESIHIQPPGLFSRLLALVDRSENMEEYFEYEFIQEPTSLFKDQPLRKPNKSNLAKIITEDAISLDTIPPSKIVIDGGALLHQVWWRKGATYNEIFHQYSEYLNLKHGFYAIVFDGYDNGPSSKDHEHMRRSETTASFVKIDLHASVVHQLTFLSNEKNKSQFIHLLSDHLHSCGFNVHQSQSDADTLLVKCALDLTLSGYETTVIADDTIWPTHISTQKHKKEAKPVHEC